jgi:N-acetylglutamate synthase-like GNAT family acetyltransferase
MFDQYPKNVRLKNGVECIIRPLASTDQDQLYRYFIRMPLEDRRYLRNNITDRILIERWCREIDYQKTLPLIAEQDGKIVANATIHRETYGWGKHIGELRITIDKEFRHQGLGPILNDELTELARMMKLERICARVVVTRDYVLKAAEQNGFKQIAVLKDYIKNVHDNSYEDVAILVKNLEPEKQL